MDGDLAFCLGEFIDDQVQGIDGQLERLKQEEIIECQKIEQEKILFDQKKPIPKSKGSHDEDTALVNQFIQELRDSTSKANTTKTIMDDQSCIDTLRAELSTKVNACANYITRLHNLAKPLNNTTNFVQTCKTTTDYFKRTDEFENNFKTLYSVLEESDADDVVKNTQRWWKEKYGSMIADLNTRNQKINSAITENNFAILSSTSRVLDNAKKLIAARKIITVESPKLEIIRKFVRRLLAVDEEKRDQTVDPDELINQLNSTNIEQMINYAETWLRQRDEIRNKKVEKDPYETRLEQAKAEFGRRRIAQEAKKLALAALLCRLAVGSTNSEQFDQQLKKTVNKQKKSNDESLPVISGDIKDPEDAELPFVIQLELNTDMDQWVANTDGIRERFAAVLCQAFHIPDKKIRVDGVDADKCIILLCVLPPYGKNVIDSLNGTATDAAARMQAVRKCCLDVKANVESITLGELGLKVEDKLMDPRWNRKYAWPNSSPDDGQYWANPIDQGGRPYYCPSGWKRFGVKVAADEKEFDAQWGTWFLAYHGTRGENASKILTSGLRVSTQGCFYGDGVARVYVSPSIEYCGHPRYAFPWKQTKKNGETCWYQLVFQCRVNPASVNKVDQETLIKPEFKETTLIDKNFSNSELEWIILGKDGEQFIKNDIVCYGLMLRISTVDPDTLPTNMWWKQCAYEVGYKT